MIKKEVPKRSKSGIVHRTNPLNKKSLVTDFSHRCAYCDDLDIYGGGYRSYQVEHFAPKTKFSHLEFCYDNLLYACPWCNRAKWDLWPSNDPNINVVNDEGFIDPCTTEYYSHLDRDNDGNIYYLTPLGKYMYSNLKLYLKRHEVIYNLERLKEAKDRLKISIDQDKKKSIDTSKKEIAMKSIIEEFFEYYDLWSNIEKNN